MVSMTLAAPPPEPGGKLPGKEDLRRLRFREGWTYQQIQDTYGVTNQAVYKALRKHGLVGKPRASYDMEIPWVIERKDRWDNNLRLLRTAARDERGTLGTIDSRKRREYDNWRNRLKRWDAVVAYGWHRNKAGERVHGFYWTKRRPGVDEWLIRVPSNPSSDGG